MKHASKLVVSASMIVAVIFAIVLFSAPASWAESDAQKQFAQLKQLEGNWVGTDSKGQKVEVSFRTTAGGSALMSEIHGQGPENMITMFHLDGDRLLLTHYCGAGNQPRMKVISADAKSLSFEFVDGTNIGPGDGHMQHVTFTQQDADHHTEDWRFDNYGKELKQVFVLERTK